MSAWQRVWETAVRQCGVIATVQVVACGVAARTFTDRVRRDGWHQVHRGVWAVPGPLTYRGSLHAAVLAAGGEAALTGLSTLWLVEVVNGTPRRVDPLAAAGPGPSAVRPRPSHARHPRRL